MNFDNFNKVNIKILRSILSRLDIIHKGKYKYSIYFKYIDRLLLADFNKTDKYLVDKEAVNKGIPEKFWVMWWQGIKKAPPIVKQSILQLEKVFGKNKVIIITRDNYKSFSNIDIKLIKKFENGQISLTNWSDIIRFNILNSNGGIWIDSTVAISPKFKDFISNYIEKKDVPFYSICNIQEHYEYVSNGMWSIWLIGGEKHYKLFGYICKFYEVYFQNHSTIIDYYVTDDVIAHYYNKDIEFRRICKSLCKNWNVYYWVNNFSAEFDIKMIEKFNNDLNYSVQKLTYKYDKNINRDGKLLNYLLTNNWVSNN